MKSRGLLGSVRATLSMMAGVCASAEPEKQLRCLQVELPHQEHDAIKASWPGIGCWFWTAEEFQPEGYKRFLDLYEKHSAFRLLTHTPSRQPKVAISLGISVVAGS